MKKKKLLFLFGGRRKLTSVKSRPNWDLAYAATVEALLLLFFEPARLSILQNWLGFSSLSVALPLGLVVEVDVDSPVDKACAKVYASALGALSCPSQAFQLLFWPDVHLLYLHISNWVLDLGARSWTNFPLAKNTNSIV